MQDSNIPDNLNLLWEMKKDNPNATHVYLRRDDGESVDIPMFHAETTIRNNPRWKVEGLATAVKNNQGVTVPTEPVTLPPKPSEKPKDSLSNDSKWQDGCVKNTTAGEGHTLLKGCEKYKSGANPTKPPKIK